MRLLLRSTVLLGALGALALLALAAAAADSGVTIGRQTFADRRDPPPWRELPPSGREAFDLGLLIFNTPWVLANSPNAARIDGIGPLFVGASCDGCHNNGARGRPPDTGDSPSNSFVMQLDGGKHPYGAVLNTAAIDGHAREGLVTIEWAMRNGRFADGSPWALREPRYRLTRLLYGEPEPTTILRPRIAPPVYGAGLLERVPLSALEALRNAQPQPVRGELAAGRFGWLGDAGDLEEQSARAFAREMGLTSERLSTDDCTAEQVACRNAPHGGTPEVSAEFMGAIVSYQRELAVPARKPIAAERDAAGQRLFDTTGCAACHAPQLPVRLDDGTPAHIDAFSDLLLHDLGDELADRDAGGRVVTTRWRTAPLWGLAHARRFGRISLLHDGRAASVQEAILWHGGQAAQSRELFTGLSAGDRSLLEDWVNSL